MSNESEKIFIETVQKYERVIYKVCSFYTTKEFPMEDLYQEVIINLWRAFHRFRNESSISTWIYKISLNTCISGMRKEKSRPKGLPVTSSLYDSLAETENMDLHIQEMYQLIHKLKTLERAIILLYLEEKSYQEIADITGLTVNNVAIKLMRIKEKLKKMSNC